MSFKEGTSKPQNEGDKEDKKERVINLTYSLLPLTCNLKYGGVAQLGEHLPCKQGVMGSNPIISTRSGAPDSEEPGGEC